MTAQKSWRKVLATGTAGLVVAGGLSFAPAAAFADDEDAALCSVGEGAQTFDGIDATWAWSDYSNGANHIPGSTSPYAWTKVGDDANITVDDKNFVFSDGVASASDECTTVAFQGAARVEAYQSHFPEHGQWVEIVDPLLVLDADGNGAWTAEVRSGEGDLNESSSERVAVATVTGAEVPDFASDTRASVTFDYADAVEAGTWKDGYTGAWPTEFVNLVPSQIQAFYYESGAGSDADKPASPLDLAWGDVTFDASVSDATEGKLTVDAQLENVRSATGAYVSLIEAGTADELTKDNLGVASAWVMPNMLDENGDAAVQLVATADKLDRTKDYEVISWQAHTMPTDVPLYGEVALDITDAQWDAIFPAENTEPKPETPSKSVEFTDVKKGDKFFTEISWMGNEGISTGKKQADGTYKYDPKGNVTREAMAAFLYRINATDEQKEAAAPASSKFTDVKAGDPFYKEIAWMDSEGISTGKKQADGSVKFDPKGNITREAMAAFMYRLDADQTVDLSKASPFTDMKSGDKFYKEILWMAESGLSTGKKQADGSYQYDPKGKTTREAMAAFLYRAAQ